MFVVEKITIKMLSIERKKLSETAGRRINRWGKSILLMVFLGFLWFIMESSDTVLLFYLLINLVLLFGYQAVMEFIFIRNSRQYIATTILLIVIISSIAFLYFIKC
ncbi:DUF4181 domain-containing protein [Oceanobacillus indicireducens]|uniref:DUF4181 domain-containing protein n=1 Tax=Oceanobacillus indicireducens TaxID=1004261 RepID=UPI00166A1235